MPTFVRLIPAVAAATPAAFPGRVNSRPGTSITLATMTLSFFERYGMGLILLILLGFGGLIGYEKIRDNNLKHGLMLSIQKGDAEGVKRCLAEGADPNLVTNEPVNKPSVGRFAAMHAPGRYTETQRTAYQRPDDGGDVQTCVYAYPAAGQGRGCEPARRVRLHCPDACHCRRTAGYGAIAAGTRRGHEYLQRIAGSHAELGADAARRADCPRSFGQKG